MAVAAHDRDGFVWMDGQFVPNKDAKVHVLTHAIHYGSCVFEGERAYDGTIFKSGAHTKRLFKSAEIMDMQLPFSFEQIESAKAQLISKNNLPNGYVRAFAWRGSEALGVSAPENKIHVAVAAFDWPSYFDPIQRMKGVRLDVAEYRRPDPMTAPSTAKASGLYMICTISKHKAMRKGYADALMLDWQGRVAECTGANVFFMKDGVIHTPIADCFLDGITRQTVIELAKRRGIKVEERRILPDELAHFSECFITGSAAELTPVAEIGPYNFKPDAMTKTLIDDYTNEVRMKKAA